MKILVGSTIFLEHILHYKDKEEKGRVKIPPLAQIGGGAWNIAKTLENLSVIKKDITIFGYVSSKSSPQQTALKYLLEQEKVNAKLLPVRKRVSTSYYLVPKGGKTWAFGDPGELIEKIPIALLKDIEKASKKASIRILTEVTGKNSDLKIAKTIFKKHGKSKLNVLIPSVHLINSGRLSEILPLVDMLSCNEEEAKLAGLNLKKNNLPYVFVTRGEKSAFLKIAGDIFEAKPKLLKNPKYVGGAGDAATAALVKKLFIDKEKPKKALVYALEIGRKVLQTPNSYYTQ